MWSTLILCHFMSEMIIKFRHEVCFHSVVVVKPALQAEQRVLGSIPEGTTCPLWRLPWQPVSAKTHTIGFPIGG